MIRFFLSIMMFLNENQIKFDLPSSEANCITLLGNMKDISPIFSLFLQPAFFSVLPQLSPLHYKRIIKAAWGVITSTVLWKLSNYFQCRYLISAELQLGLGMTVPHSIQPQELSQLRKGLHANALVSLANHSFRLPSSLLQDFPSSSLFIRG